MTQKIPLVCRINLHKWRFSHGGLNTYEECERCGKRRVRVYPHLYQPIDRDWLEGKDRLK